MSETTKFATKPRPLEVEQGGEPAIMSQPVLPVAVGVHRHVGACLTRGRVDDREKAIDKYSPDDSVAIGGDELPDQADELAPAVNPPWLSGCRNSCTTSSGGRQLCSTSSHFTARSANERAAAASSPGNPAPGVVPAARR